MLDVLEMGKRLVERGDLTALQAAFDEFRTDPSADEAWLFQKVYLHACLKGHREIAEWLEGTVFPTMDPIAQIAVRQGFAYGRHLLGIAERRRQS